MSRNRRNKTILVIEDDADIQHFLARVLELEGYRVCRSSDGAAGLEIVRNDRVSLVLLDLILPPGPDGWSVLREMKQDILLAHIPVIVLTALARADQRRRALHLGAASYLVKPVSARELARAVRDVLERKTVAKPPGKTSPATR